MTGENGGSASREVRATVKALVERGGRYLLLKQVHDPGDPAGHVWTLPGGGVDFGERPREALRREVREETGLTVAVGDPVGVYTLQWATADRRVHSVATAFAATPAGEGPDGGSGDGDTDASGEDGGSAVVDAVDLTGNPADEPVVDHGWFAPGEIETLRMDPALAELFERVLPANGEGDDGHEGDG